MKRTAAVLLSFVTISYSLLTSTVQAADAITEQDAYTIAVEAYVYFYPLVLMDVTRKVATNLPSGVKPGIGPVNSFNHIRTYPDANFRDVVRPNFDTLYSSAWVNVTEEPVVISAPDTNGRYYLLPMLDMWTDVFAVPGKRTSGTAAHQWLVYERGWKGNMPAGMDGIESPTPMFWIIGRTQTNGKGDYAAVNKLQDKFSITPLSQFGKKIEPVAFNADATIDMKTPPMTQINSMPAEKYFSYAAELMKINPPHLTDWSQVARLKNIGIEPGKSFNFAQASPNVQAALKRATVDGFKLMQDKTPTLARIANGWQMNTDTMGVYGNYYLKRAIIALVGLGANQSEDAIYPLCIHDSNGKPLDGANNYVLHFQKNEIPPVGAFWSVTMYDAEGFQSANKLNRFAIGDRDSLKYNADGSLDLYLQHASPGQDKESNWLPAPTGPLGVTMRLYAPKAEALDGRWVPPAVKKI